LNVAKGFTSDHSICSVPTKTLELMEIQPGAYVQLRGRKQRKVICIVIPDDTLGDS